PYVTIARLPLVAEPSIIPVPSNADVVSSARDDIRKDDAQGARPRMTFTGLIGTLCWLPLKAIIAVCVKLRIHPNVLTLVGVIVNVAAAWELAHRRFVTGGVVMI